MRVHFIAIGGSAMHNLAIALHKKGYHVTGSDDEIFEPSKSRLARFGLLPETEGWDASRITPDLDAILLGMHAKADNPELIRATALGLKIFSYPEYLYEQSKNKKRVVIGGSHGKTTITAMILHVLKHAGIECDYMVGAQLEGFEVMVKLSETAQLMVLEGDEYLTSPIDKRPKFHLYHPDIAVISGIAWDHINVFPTFDNYLEQFRIFIRLISPGGSLIFCKEDAELCNIVAEPRSDISVLPYGIPEHTIHEGITALQTPHGEVNLQVFGRHNLMNLEGARMVCSELGISDEIFYKAIVSFSGASKRLELVAKSERAMVYKDFAHAPSKVEATLRAVREQYPEKHLVACLELHTFSSLSEGFLGHYAGSMNQSDTAIVYFSPHALALKRLPLLTAEQVRKGFANQKLEVFTEPSALLERLRLESGSDTVFLMMSSGNYDGIDLRLVLPQD